MVENFFSVYLFSILARDAFYLFLFHVLYKMCLVWWLHVKNVETYRIIKHLNTLSCVDCHYIIINLKHNGNSNFKKKLEIR